MSTTITFRRGTAAPTQGAGLTLGEPAFDTTNRNLYMGLGSGVTAAWIGARISGLSSDISAGLTNWIVNAKAIKDYVDVVSTTPENVAYVNQSNTFTQGQVISDFSASLTVQYITADSEASIAVYPQRIGFKPTVDAGTQFLYGSSTSGSKNVYLPDASGTLALTSQLMGTINGSTAATTAVTSFNGLTGAVGGVCAASANTFTALQTFSSGITASELYVSGNSTLVGNVLVGSTLTVSGNLIINGTTTTINSTTISVDDKNIVLGDLVGADDVTAQGGGISLKSSAGDKTIYWSSDQVTEGQAAYSWNTNQNFNLDSATKYYAINGALVLSGTTLGSGVVSSSLTRVGTITSGVWNSDIVYVDGGTYT